MTVRAIRPAEPMRWALMQPIEDTTAKLVLIALASAADARTGRACLDNAALMAITRAALATVKRAKTRLEREGWISRVPTFRDGDRQQASAYALHFERGIARPDTARQGTRLAQDWTLPADWRAWAVATYAVNGAAADRAGACFKEHFTGLKDGPDARRKDWRAVWRNWCKRQWAGRPRASEGGSRMSPQAAHRRAPGDGPAPQADDDEHKRGGSWMSPQGARWRPAQRLLERLTGAAA